MSVAILIGFGIWLMAIFCLLMGMFMLVRVDMPVREKYIMLGLTIFSCLWCLGYGIMVMSESIGQAGLGRTIGVIGVFFFCATVVRFLAFFCKSNSKFTKAFTIVDYVWALVCVGCMTRPEAVSFVRTSYGTAYCANMDIYRGLAFAFIGVNISVAYLHMRRGIHLAKHKRDKKIVELFAIMGVLLILSSMMDAMMPSFGKPSFPASCLGVFAAMGMIYFLGLSMNAFSITKNNVSKYIFENVATPVLILKEDMELAMANESAEKFFKINVADGNIKFYDLFELSQNDADTYIKNAAGGLQHESCRLIAKENHAVCELSTNPILDEFGEPTCMVVFVNDLTKEYKLIEKLKNKKSVLEEKLEEKNHQMQSITRQAITTVANFIDSKEAYTLGHSTRVAQYAKQIAEELGWTAEECSSVYYVGLLHDIGKIGVSHEILNKPSKLTDEEYEIMKTHSVIGGDILKDIKTLENASVGALCHHERYDGKGYPAGLKGDEIPMIARVIGIADAFDAMTSNRRYRAHLEMDVVREEISRNAGKQFDPYITSVVLRMLDEGRLKIIEGAQEIKADHGILMDGNILISRLFGDDMRNARLEISNDYLTQVWDKETGERKIKEYLKYADGCLMLIDLDDFKSINEDYGHLKGDKALKLVADVLRAHAKEEYLCRLGGDKFMLFVRDISSVDEAKKILDALTYTYNCKAEETDLLTRTSLSIGVALSVKDGRDYDELYQCADRALYYVKQNGKHGYSFHRRAERDYEDDEKILSLNRLVTSLRSHTEYNGAYKVEYQRFFKVHEFIEKYAARNHQSVQLVLLTIDYDNSIETNVNDRTRIIDDLEYTVTSALRGVDVCTRFSNAQLLVTLVDTNASNVNLVMRRIMSSFYRIHRPEDIIVEFESEDISIKSS